jgi:hypothetical protein
MRMRGAPPVSVTCEGGPLWAGFQAGLPALAGAALATWLVTWAELPPAAGAGLVLLASAAAGLAGWQWLRLRSAPLAWDGACWSAGLPADCGQVEIMVDLGAWLLLRFRPESAAAPVRWLAVSGKGAGGALHGLRVALHGSPPRPAAGLRSAETQSG